MKDERINNVQRRSEEVEFSVVVIPIKLNKELSITFYVCFDGFLVLYKSVEI